MKRLRAEDLQAVVTSACEKMGARREDAELVASLLVCANLCGYDSHGVFRLAQYHGWWKAGLLNPGAQPVIAEETALTAKVDGRHAFGQVVASFATRVAIDKAKRSGIAVVTAKDSNHVGRLADYAETIRGEGFIGLVMVNDSGSGQFVVPWGGIDPRLATNPIAMGIPGGEGGGILFDFSTSAAAFGKVRQLQMRGEPTPSGWLIDASGRETTDPASLFREPRSSLLPAGGHRGFALSLVVEVLAGILSGAGSANPHPGPEEMNGIFILAADVSWFLPLDQFRAHVDQLTAYMKTSRPMPGIGPVHIPGEKSRQEEARRRRDGIVLNQQTWETFSAVLIQLGLSPEPIDR